MEQQDSDIRLAETVDKVVKEEDSNLIHLSTGVVLKARQVNPLTLIKVMSQYKRPEPPEFFVKEMGRSMLNPNDEEYQKRLKDHEMQSSNALVNALILLGTTLVSKPDGMSSANQDEWLDILTTLGLPIRPDNRSWRWLAWVTEVACQTAEDMAAITKAVGKLSGVREDAVKAAESFSGRDQKS